MSAIYPIPRQIREATVLAAANQTVFGPFDFLLFDAEDVQVRTQAPDADMPVLVDPSAYTVTPAAPYIEWPAPPMVTFAVGLVLDTRVWVTGARLHSRLTNVTQGGAIRSIALERELDRQSVVLQELRRDTDRLEAGAGNPPALASGIQNDSAVTGDTVKAALDTLNAAAAANAAAIATNAAAARVSLARIRRLARTASAFTVS